MRWFTAGIVVVAIEFFLANYTMLQSHCNLKCRSRNSTISEFVFNGSGTCLSKFVLDVRCVLWKFIWLFAFTIRLSPLKSVSKSLHIMQVIITIPDWTKVDPYRIIFFVLSLVYFVHPPRTNESKVKGQTLHVTRRWNLSALFCFANH